MEKGQGSGFSPGVSGNPKNKEDTRDHVWSRYCLVGQETLDRFVFSETQIGAWWGSAVWGGGGENTHELEKNAKCWRK